MNVSDTRSTPLICRILLLLSLLLSGPGYAQDEGRISAEKSQDSQVMHAFAAEKGEADGLALPAREKHLILFIMGAALLICILATAALGVAMAIYGKRVFIPHMIFAGFSVTLAIVHSIVAIVWFFPFSSSP